LIELKHKIHEEELKAGIWDKKGGKEPKEKKGGRKSKPNYENQSELF